MSSIAVLLKYSLPKAPILSAVSKKNLETEEALPVTVKHFTFAEV